MATLMPRARSSRNSVRLRSGSCIAADSVISSSSSAASMPLSASRLSSSGSRPAPWHWRADKLTAMRSWPSPCARHAPSKAKARRSTQSPSGSISPDSSAIGMKRSGATMPSSGWCQRSSASAPMTARSDRRICGCRYSSNSCCSSASHSRCSSNSRSCVAAFIAPEKNWKLPRPWLLAAYIAVSAMYAAKSQGRGNFQFFSGAMNAATHERLLLEHRLWLALEQHEFELYLQPQIRLSDRAVIGAEALLRWHHPELGMVAPDRFIPIAEESGLILPLGDWVLRRAFALLGAWRAQGLGQLRIAVNLSARQCHGAGLLPLLDSLLADSGIDAGLLELEITESAAMQDPERSRTLLRELRARGIKVAIDDFGTGYSSLSYLKLFEIDRIKIDRGFVKDIETDPNDAVIVAATIALAHSLGLGVVAEGVETQAQCDFLRAKQCEEAQGYLFARPMPAGAFEAMMQAETAAP